MKHTKKKSCNATGFVQKIYLVFSWPSRPTILAQVVKLGFGSAGTSADAQEDQKREQSGDADTAAAREFKDRLVDYDRNSRQRTTVVDDQNDFFEIDTNSWLDPEVSWTLQTDVPCIKLHCFPPGTWLATPAFSGHLPWKFSLMGGHEPAEMHRRSGSS